MQEEKMLAVRLPPDVVEETKEYAHIEQKKLKDFVAELIQFELLHDKIYLQFKSQKLNENERKKEFSQYRKAQRSGQILSWHKKKMLAVRLPIHTFKLVKQYATEEQKNICVVLEELIRVGLARKRGENIDQQILEHQMNSTRSPYRARHDR